MKCATYLSFTQLSFYASIKPTKLKCAKQRHGYRETCGDLNSMMRQSCEACLQSKRLKARQRRDRCGERTSMKTRRNWIINGVGGACAGLRHAGLNGLQSFLFCLCQPLLIWSPQHQRASWCILLWCPPASPAGPIKSWKTQFASLTLSCFFSPSSPLLLLFSRLDGSVLHPYTLTASSAMLFKSPSVSLNLSSSHE